MAREVFQGIKMDYVAFSQVLLIGFTAALASKIVMYKMVDMDKLNTLKKEIKQKQKELRKMKAGTKAYEKLSTEIIDKNLEISKMQLKPSTITFIPFFLLFMWMNVYFKKTPAFIILPFSLPIIGNDIGWLLTYILSTMIFSAILTKIFETRYGRDK